MELLGVIVVLVIAIPSLWCLFWALKVTISGAGDLFLKAGPLLLIAWVLAFPAMLLFSFFWGLAIRGDDYDARGDEFVERVVQRMDKDKAEFEDYCLGKVIHYEADTAPEQRSRYGFNEFMISSWNSIWENPWQNQIHKTNREKLLDALDYPEGFESDLVQAVNSTRTEQDFLKRNERLVRYFGGSYPTNSEWRVNEENDRQQALKEKAVSDRKNELRARLSDSEPP